MSTLLVDTSQLRRLGARLRAFEAEAKADLLESIAGLLEAQTKRRIADEKETPDGVPWDDWSPAYAKTRRPRHSLLIDTGNLLDSVFAEVEGDTVRVTAGMQYSEFVNHEREFLGLSQANRDEIVDAIEDTFQELFR